MAWKTKDVDHACSEAYWIFIMILVQIEVVIFAVPTVAVLRDTPSTDISYIGYAILVCLCFFYDVVC